MNRKQQLINTIENGFVNSANGVQPQLNNSKGKNFEDYKIYGNSQQSKTFIGAKLSNGSSIGPRIPISWSDVVKIKIIGKQELINNQNIWLCINGGQWFGANDGNWAFNGGLAGTTDKTYAQFATGEINDVTITLTSSGNVSKFISFIWDLTWAKARTIYKVTFWNSNNEIIADVEAKENGKFYNNTTNSYLDNYVDQYPTTALSNSVFEIENGEFTIPTPEAPIEVKSLGETTRNLFDYTKLINGYRQNDGSLVSNNDWRTTDKIAISSDYITISGDKLPNAITFWNENGVGARQAYTQNTYATSGKTYIAMDWVSVTSEQLSDIQLELGNVATDYVPYNAITIKEQGKNLFNGEVDLSNSGIGVPNIINTPQTSPSVYQKYAGPAFAFHVTGGKTYTISGEINKSNSGLIVSTYRNSRYGSDGAVANWDVTLPITIKVPDDKEWVIIAVWSQTDNNNVSWENIQCEESSTATPYEPYREPFETTIDLTGHEPLRKVEDVVDYIDYENQRIVRNIGKIKVPTNCSSYSYNGTSGVFFFALETKYDKAKGLCNRESKIGAYYLPFGNHYMWIGAGNAVVYWCGILDALGLTLEEFNSWIIDNPTFIYYQLATPTSEPITLQEIETLKGSVGFSANDDLLTSSNNIVKYRASVKE